MGRGPQRPLAYIGRGSGSPWSDRYRRFCQYASRTRDATQTIPIVFFIGTDPVKVGLVKGLARPGGNITGITITNVELITKSIDLAHSIMPPATTIGVLVNPANAPQTAVRFRVVKRKCPLLAQSGRPHMTEDSPGARIAAGRRPRRHDRVSRIPAIVAGVGYRRSEPFCQI
jgi:hypothetical protein